jgi:acetyl-CoA C-acetyltransferase
MEAVVILDGVRTGIGTFGGMFRHVPAVDLAVPLVEALLKRTSLAPDEVDEVILGHCMMRSDEINPARCVCLRAGLPVQVPAFTVQRQCASGMQAVVSAMQQIQTGAAQVVIAGGTENMSRVPYVLKDFRFGKRMWNGEVTDALTEGLHDPLGHYHMGVTAENLAQEFDITREAQDELALSSHRRALAAMDNQLFENEIVPIEVPQKRGAALSCRTDEHPRREVTAESLAHLRPVFRKDGTVTAGNASGINDGAAAVIVASRSWAEKRGLPWRATLVDHQAAGVEPERMGIGPVPAVQRLLARQEMSLDDIDVVELNEAFAAQYLACERALGLDRARTNVNGSGIALGHPVGATGCRIMVTLLNEMERRSAKWGLATLCVGGGMGKATLLRRDS